MLKAGWADPEPQDTGMTPIQLVAWYFGKQLGQREPQDMDAYVEELCLSSRADFYRFLAREYLYSICNEQES